MPKPTTIPRASRTGASNRALNAGSSPRERAKAWLVQHGSPRFVMSLMLASTVGCGFLASVGMHRLGLDSPKWRYPLAVLAGWMVFLALVRVWVWWQRREYDPDARRDGGSWFSSRRSSTSRSGSSIDLPGGGSGSSSGSGGGGSWGGRGGGFGGGGASDSFAESPVVPVQGFGSGGSPIGLSPGVPAGGDGGGDAGLSDLLPSSAGGGGGSSGGSGGFDLDLGDDAGAFIILVIGAIVVAAAVFGVAFYAVYSAPTFFAELLIDGGVGTWIYKRVNVRDEPDWLGTAVRRSIWPMLATLVLFWLFGGLIEYLAPHATTIGQAFSAVWR